MIGWSRDSFSSKMNVQPHRSARMQPTVLTHRHTSSFLQLPRSIVHTSVNCSTTTSQKPLDSVMPPTTSSPNETLEQTGSRLQEWNSDREERYAKDRYGRLCGTFLKILSNSMIERLVESEYEALHGTDEDLKAWKSSMAGELSMVAVAVRILDIKLAGIASWTCSSPKIGCNSCPDRHYQFLITRHI